jgi:cation diffusion facilitator family transporter
VPTEQSQGESTPTVVIAFCANFAIAVAKSIAAAMTGSASLAAEAAHSWADTGNQVLLLIADKRSRRPPDRERPWGYGREAYVWSMLAALGLFVAGGVVSFYHGITELQAESVDTDYTVGYIVLAVAFCFEGVSFGQAFRRTRREARTLDRDLLDHALATSDPTLRAVLAEDAAALVGIVVATAGIALHQWTGEAVYDAVGSMMIGVLLCLVALILIDRNRRFLIGQIAETGFHDAVLARLQELPGVARVTALRLEFLGPRQLLLVAAVDLVGDDPEPSVALRLKALADDLESDGRILEAVLTLATPDEPSIAIALAASS